MERCRARQSCGSHGERLLSSRGSPFTNEGYPRSRSSAELTEEWRTGARRWLEGVKKIRLDKRIYEDETPVFANEAPKRGRARTGNTHPSSAISLRHKVHVACKRKAEWCAALATCRTEMQTPKRLQRVAIDAVGAMKSGETVIWDRLGRSGRAVNPSSQHYSPVARDLFDERGVSIKFLPPKGKYFKSSRTAFQ